jgi:arginine repressor
MQLSSAKNKCSSVEEKSKKMMEEKDAKVLKMMEEMSAIRLEKEQLALRYGVLKDENYQKSQRIRNFEEKIKQMEEEMTER